MSLSAPDRDLALSRTVARLLGLTTLPVLLLAGRVVYTRSLTHTYVAWNLCLAWLPLAFAYLALRPGQARLLRLAFGLAWLLFLPNAPYLVTDLIHLPYGSGIPILYDVVLLFAAALCGLALGLVSLRWVQAAVAAWLGAWPGRLFVLVVVGMAGFGVYLGRYLRWSSWDVLLSPAALARDIWLHLIHPVQHWQAWALALLFAILLAFAHGLLATLDETKHPPAGL
ncbi:MAG: DUF1361 domain-containing protein [Anaerolineae bacterium]|nr:DUF1361 domain-containing protein [Anaerolineae bacterium]